MYENNYQVIDPNYSVYKLKQYHEGKLYPLEREQMREYSIPSKYLNQKFTSKVHEVKRRGGVLPNLYQFQRALIFAIKQTATKYRMSAQKVMENFEVHSINLIDYQEFQLLPKAIHKKLHANKDKRFVCHYCTCKKPIQEFTLSKVTNSKVYRTCKKCKSKLVTQNKKIREDKANV